MKVNCRAAAALPIVKVLFNDSVTVTGSCKSCVQEKTGQARFFVCMLGVKCLIAYYHKHKLFHFFHLLGSLYTF